MAFVRRRSCFVRTHVSCRCARFLQVASVADVFAMSEEGPSGNFVNTHGYVHDMVTLRRAVHVDAVGEPEVENSWFKGCGSSGAHGLMLLHRCGGLPDRWAALQAPVHVFTKRSTGLSCNKRAVLWPCRYAWRIAYCEMCEVSAP